MRQIKFRAWTGNEMITPPNDTVGCGSGAEIIEISLAGHISKRNAYGLDVFGGKNPSFDEPEKDIVLFQFSGLKDIRGLDIYEGDILEIIIKSNDKIISLRKEAVIFEEGCFGVCFGNRREFQTLRNFYNTDFRIIGNVYENPESL